jgi:16S rRNA (guanine527-N7)-methyltransferase
VELGLSLDPERVERLVRYRSWLAEEGIAGGAIGPNEGEQILERHVLEGLGFVAGFDAAPDQILDVGSGAGIPGIPLAIAWPDSVVTLLDRSGRKTSLLRRAVRVLELDNLRVQAADADVVEPGWPAVVMRAVFSPARTAIVLDRLLAGSGTGVAAIGFEAVSPPPPAGRRMRTVTLESRILARRLRLLIMAPL